MILFGIVTYKEKFWECKSFQTLYSSYKESGEKEKLFLFVFDNTDIEDWDLKSPDFPDIQIEYFNNKANPGIPAAYNAIAGYAKDNNFDNIAFLDQDSELPANLYSVYLDYSLKKYPLCVPQIFSDNKIVSPSLYINFRPQFYDKFDNDELPLKGNSCINTGIMIKTDIFFKNNGYNTDIRLDFSDHEFLDRLTAYDINMKIMPVVIKQNFSFIDNTKKQDIFRYKFFIKDLKVYSKSSKKPVTMFFYVDLPRLLRLSFRHKSLEFLKIRIKS